MSVQEGRAQAHQVAVVLGTAALVLFLWGDEQVRDLLLVCAGVGMPVAVLLGVRLHRPRQPGVWLCLAAACVLWGLGVSPLPFSTIELWGDVTARDLLSVGGYVALIVGVLGATRRVTHDRPVEVAADVSIFALGCVSVVWAAAVDQSGVAGVSVTTMASPFLDVMALSAGARLVLVGGEAPAPMLLLGSLGLLTLGDLANLRQSPMVVGGALPGAVLFLGAYVCAALAALHPSMARVGTRAARRVPHLERTHLAALSLASFLPPLMLLTEGDSPARAAAGPLAVMAATTFVLVVTRLQRTVRVVEEQRIQLEALARTDHLTSLPNRRTGEAELHRMVAEAVAQGAPLVAALLDLDHFKAYNDRHGHQAGDRLLEATASAWRRSLPPDVFVSRHGGEEFLLLAKGRGPDDVRRLLEGLRGAARTGQTFSAGLAVWDGVESMATLLDRADRALYAAKDGGRDQVCLSEPEPLVLPAARG